MKTEDLKKLQFLYEQMLTGPSKAEYPSEFQHCQIKSDRLQEYREFALEMVPKLLAEIDRQAVSLNLKDSYIRKLIEGINTRDIGNG